MSRVRAALIWGSVLAATTVALYFARVDLDKAHVALVLLLVVLGASAAGGRALGLVIAATSFILFDLLFLAPYGTLVVANPLDWLVLVAFLVTSVVAAQLLVRAQEQSERARLHEADKLKDALIASVSHDLRTPLTTIKALAHDLSALGDERAQMIEVEADRLNRFVRDLLDLSRLSAGALPLQIELNAVDELIGGALQAVEGTPAARRIVVELPEDGTLLVGRFDLSYAIRVLVNLIENAEKYSPSESEVTVRARRDGPRLLIAVADRGPGVAASETERVFTPFYRTPDAPSDAGSAGLGLSIARRLADAQGGALFYAAREGGGSVFTLQLPAADLDEALADAAMFTNR